MRGGIRVLGALVFIGVAALTFKLFEPVFVWRLGWADLPAVQTATKSNSADGWAEPAAAFDRMLEDARDRLDAPSLSAAFSVDGEIVWAGAIGYADIEARSLATPSTVYRVGSTSKAITSVATGVLLDRGAIELDAPLSRAMPDLAQPLASVTVRQAMSHTGGVRNYGLCLCFPVWEHLNRVHYEGPQRDTLSPFERSPLLFTPGEGFAYTSLGYNALGGVIEAASGRSFEMHLREAVLSPLSMTSTYVEDGDPREGLAQFYEVESERYKRAFEVDNSNKFPSGGILSTPTDMARLGAAMIRPLLFSEATRDLLIAPTPVEANDQGYALGWRFNSEGKIKKETAVTPRYGHHGTAQGSTSFFSVYPKYGLVVSVMMNKGQHNLDALGAEASALADAAVMEIERRRAAIDDVGAPD